MTINSDVDILLAIEKLGKKAEEIALSQSIPPHTIKFWVKGETGDDQPTDDQINSAWTSYKNEESMRLLRVERNKRLAACDWRTSSDLTLSDDWKTYRQALRDLPASVSPKIDSNGDLDMTSVTFPTEPS